MVDNGGVVVDVSVDNALYGELRATLNLTSRYDVEAFITQAEGNPACLLSRMTGRGASAYPALPGAGDIPPH